MSKPNCQNCQAHLIEDDKFCPSCGNPVIEKTDDRSSKQDVKTISSSGNYSGKMIKGKTSGSWKIIRNVIIAIVVFGIVALIIWFQVDPEAGEKLTNVLFGLGFMAVFAFFIYRAAKKGKYKGKKGYNINDEDWDDNDDNDYDDGGDDD